MFGKFHVYRLDALLLAGLFGLASVTTAATASKLTVEGEQFVLVMPDGSRLTSPDLVGAEFETEGGQLIRIDKVQRATERPSLLLHTISVREGRDWRPLCEPDAYGRSAGFPVSGRWSDTGSFIKDRDTWFLTCTSGSQGKCILWGYDPWSRGPRGQDLVPLYEACQFAVRADYEAKGTPHTRNGTVIDLADVFGISAFDTKSDENFAFEAGWGRQGATCVARTRLPELLSREDLLRSSPDLGGQCTEATARRRGALIMTRVKRSP
jgi:hypothetical protein